MHSKDPCRDSKGRRCRQTSGTQGRLFKAFSLHDGSQGTPSSINGNAATCRLCILTPQRAPPRDSAYGPLGTAHIYTHPLLIIHPNSRLSEESMIRHITLCNTCRHKVMPAFPKCLLGTQSKVPEASQQPAFLGLGPAVKCFYAVTVPMCRASILSGLFAAEPGFFSTHCVLSTHSSSAIHICSFSLECRSVSLHDQFLPSVWDPIDICNLPCQEDPPVYAL